METTEDKYIKEINNYTSLLKICNKDDETFFKRGLAYYNLSIYKLSEYKLIGEFEDYGRTTKQKGFHIIFERSFKYQYNYGRYWFANERKPYICFDEAVDDFNNAIMLKADIPEYYFCRGNAYYNIGELKNRKRKSGDYLLLKEISINLNIKNKCRAPCVNRELVKYYKRLINCNNDAINDWVRAFEMGYKPAVKFLGSFIRNKD